MFAIRWPSIAFVLVMFFAATPARSEERTAAAQMAAVQAAVIRSSQPATVAVREEVDPEDSVERFLLLAPGAPIVVEASITIDGKSFRIPREKLIDEMLSIADRDKDGVATWAEALRNPRFSFGRFQQLQAAQASRGYDTNGNYQVDRVEVRRFMAQLFGGADFVIGSASGNAAVVVGDRRVLSGAPQPDLKKLLDSDSDGIISREEIAGAGQRLKSRDADDNDLLLPNEATDVAATGYQGAAVFVRDQPVSQNALLLGPTVDASAVWMWLKRVYRQSNAELTADSFPALPQLFEQLDGNQNGKLEAEETLAFNKIKPHIQLSVNLGKRDGVPIVAVVSTADDLGKPEIQSGDAARIVKDNLRFAFSGVSSPAVPFNYDATATQLLQMYDKDGNGYLDEKELAGNLASQFELWDEDGDGKVYPKEIAAAYTRQLAPQMSQIRASTEIQASALFQAIDRNADGRLSLREMLTAAEPLAKFDANGSGDIMADEIPLTFAVTFAQGSAFSGARVSAFGAGGMTRVAPGNRAGPDWFVRMDRNGDGDVTLKEFLGSEEQFRKIDKNSDGFIEPHEASGAK